MNEVVVTLTGVDLIKSAVVPRSLGWLPNPMVVVALPQDANLPGGGTLTLYFGAQSLQINDVKVDFSTQHYTMRGHVVIIRLLDRRWRWKYLKISGRYNIHMADGTIQSGTEKSIRELAVLLMDAMLETTYDVSVLPTDVFPEVDWTYDTAAIELSRMCEECGCDISLNWDDSVSIVQLGVGAALPINDDLQDATVKADPPEGPDKLTLVCGESQFQARLELTAVALDTDGKIKKIDDPTLSYLPATGWGDIGDEHFFRDLKNSGRTEEQVDLAMLTVFKWYQIKQVSTGTLTIPGYGTITDIAQILPINDWLVDTFTSPVGNRLTNKPAVIYGKFLLTGDPFGDRNSDACSKYPGDFVLDGFNGIVKLASRAIKYSDPVGTILPADLFLEASFGVRDSTTHQQVRKTYDFTFQPGPLTETVSAEELGLKVRATYSSGVCTSVASTVTNETVLAAEANRILTLASQRFSTAIYGSGKYRGLQALQTDGTIRQVIVIADDSIGFNTRASYNTEVGNWVVRAAQRRRRRIAEENSNINKLRVQQGRHQRRGHNR